MLRNLSKALSKLKQNRDLNPGILALQSILTDTSEAQVSFCLEEQRPKVGDRNGFSI